MSRKQEELILEVIEQKKQEEKELWNLYFDLKLKRTERSVKENKKEAAPFTPERFEDPTVIIEEETDKEWDRGRDYNLGGLLANHPDKPCRTMRERLHLKNNLCGDLPSHAPKGKCYFDYQKDCNAWCQFWEGNEDDEDVKNIREIQKTRYKIVEDKKW